MKDNRQQIMTLAEQRVRLLYADAYTRALKIAEVRKALDAATDTNFTFKANPRAEKELKKILQALGVNLDKLITDGKAGMAKKGVTAAEDNILAIVAKSDKPTAERLIQAATNTNRVAQALGTELANEKRGGVKLSPKVWKTVESSRKELEIIIQNNIIEGKGADVASREVRQYLKDPNKLFRRVKDKETGEYKLSKAAQQYHPGRGRYRSSYMNARRLTVTEMNMATQAAESAAYASNPLIAGYEIRLSNNHTVKDPSKKGGVKPLHDICDELQGRYPATFKFTGWHPHCRCTMIPILISAEERRKLAKARAEGKDYQPKGVITEMPANFNKWLEDNADRIERAKSLPYFLQDMNDPKEMAERRDEFMKYATSPDYKDTYFDINSGGFLAVHKEHQFADTKAEGAVMTGGEAETYVGRLLATKNAKQVEFLPENGKSTGKPDLSFDGKTWDVKYISKANENTIRKYIEDARKADCAIFCWDEQNKLAELKNAMSRTIGKYKKKGGLDALPNVYYINEDGMLKKL